MLRACRAMDQIQHRSTPWRKPRLKSRFRLNRKRCARAQASLPPQRPQRHRDGRYDARRFAQTLPGQEPRISPCCPHPPATPFILSEKDCLSPRLHSIFVNIPSAASEHSRGKTFAMQHTEQMRPDNACEIVVKPSSACCKARQPPFHGVIEVIDGLRAKCALKTGSVLRNIAPFHDGRGGDFDMVLQSIGMRSPAECLDGACRIFCENFSSIGKPGYFRAMPLERFDLRFESGK